MAIYLWPVTSTICGAGLGMGRSAAQGTVRTTLLAHLRMPLDVFTLWERRTGVSALRSAFEDVADGEFLEVVDFVGGFGGGPVEFGGHEGGDAGGGGHGGLGIEEEAAAAAGEDVFH